MPRRIRIRVRVGSAVCVSAVALVGAVAAAPASAAQSGAAPRSVLVSLGPLGSAPRQDVGYAIDRPSCATTVRPHHVNCFAMRRVPVNASTPGAKPYLKLAASSSPSAVANVIGPGPNGGYTPADYAAAYGYHPALKRSNQTVAVVSWFDDHTIAADLGTFDAQYGLAKETSASFRKVNQAGKKSPLPSSADGKSDAAEVALDVEAVRGVCNTCHILLVEAASSNIASIAVAENTAIRLGATEVANAFGEPEQTESKKVIAAFNHPGVVITAATGDDGWYGWDLANNPGQLSQNAAEFPSTTSTVVAVGGTEMGVSQDGSRAFESVWNEDGVEDSNGMANGIAEGASGGGCSELFKAPSWQTRLAGYRAAKCGGKRLAPDVSMAADPTMGFDIYDTWGNGDSGWVTSGGTSLAASMVAGLFALAGGSGGAEYPAASLYESARVFPSRVFDIVPSTIGLSSGTSYCDGEKPGTCGGDIPLAANTHNPNALGGGNIDCSFPRNTSDPASPPKRSLECNSAAGFDGASGLGSPNSGTMFAATNPVVRLHTPAVVHARKPTVFTVTVRTRLKGAHITHVTFNWGDGKSSSGTTLRRSHTYLRRGHRVVSVVVTDSAGQKSLAVVSITVG
jgi:hypothetical protein